MKAKLILENGREIEMELTAEQTELVRKEAKWPQIGDKYWFVGTTGTIWIIVWDDDEDDRMTFEIGNIFKTAQQAKNMARALILIEAVRQDRLELNGDWVPDWESFDAEKHYIVYDHSDGAFQVEDALNEHVGITLGYFGRFEDAKYIIKKYFGELKWYFTEFLPERG